MVATLTHFHAGPQAYAVPDSSRMHVRSTSADSPPWPPPPDAIQNILIIKLDAMGDYLLHTPMMAALRRAYPTARITLLCHPMNAAMASVNPDIDAVITPPYEPGFDSRAALLFGMSLAGGYDLAILPRWTEDWHHGGVVAEASGARWRLSYSAESTPYKKENFPQHDYFFTHVMDETAPAHEVWRGMAFLHALRMPMPATADIRQNFVCTDDDRASLLAFAPPDLPRPWIALGVGASGDFKRWPAARFAELTLALHLGMQGTVFVMGAGPADIQSAGEILALCPQGTVSLVGQMTPRQSGALVAACDVMVCNDSFPCHLAASVGTPVVLPVGHPADGNPATEYLPGRFGPWGVPFAWVQPATCDGAQFPAEDFMQDPKCIGDIPAAAIYNAVAEVLTRWKKEP